MLEVLSYQISDSIDVKAFKSAYTAELHYSDSDELFYKIANEKFIYVFKYGVVCFLNCEEAKRTEFITAISTYCKNFFEFKLYEEFQVETGCPEYKFGYNKIEIMTPQEEVLRLIMFNVSQSVALDYYSQQAEILLAETNNYTSILEKKGRLGMTGFKLKKYLARTLILKNRIAENLYIFDSVPETWEDEKLNSIDTGLKKTFDLQIRYRDIHEELQIIKENLELFKDILHHSRSSKLEWIVIILILVEVVDLVIEKIFK